MKRILLILGLYISILGFSKTAYAQNTDLFSVKVEIEQAAAMEQAAFETGDCETLISFFDDSVSFYANGNKAPSKEMIASFCKNIPRPFKNKSDKILLEVFPLSENTGYTVRTFWGKEEPSKIVEVVTKIWKKTDSKWKIIHFQSTVK